MSEAQKQSQTNDQQSRQNSSTNIGQLEQNLTHYHYQANNLYAQNDIHQSNFSLQSNFEAQSNQNQLNDQNNINAQSNEPQSNDQNNINAETSQHQSNDQIDDDDQQQSNLQQAYYNRLKMQRIRIQQLSHLHVQNDTKLKKQIQKNKLLQQQLTNLKDNRLQQTKYEQISNNYQTLIIKNKTLKQMTQQLKKQIQKLKKDKIQQCQIIKSQYQNKIEGFKYRIEQLQEELNLKQELITQQRSQFKNRQNKLVQNVNSLKNTIENMTNDIEKLRLQQRRMEKLEKDFHSKVSLLNEIKGINEIITKQKLQLKEQISNLNVLLQQKDNQLKDQGQKYRCKLSLLKKDAKLKQRQMIDLKQSSKRYQRDYKQAVTFTNQLKLQINKMNQMVQLQKYRYEVQLNRQKLDLQSIINEHLETIEQLIKIKVDLSQENKKLMNTLKKKEVLQKQRKIMLRDEFKEIDKLQKVINKIV